MRAWPAFALSSVLGLSVLAHAQDTDETEPLPEYRVELIVFMHLAEHGAEELWSYDPDSIATEDETTGVDDPDADDELGVGDFDQRPDPAAGDLDDAPPALSFRIPDREALEMGEIVQRMRRSRDFRPLWHGGWIQPGYPRGNAPAMALVRVGDLPDALDGTVTMSLSRYLHLTLDLTLTGAPGAGNAAPASPDVYRLRQSQRLRSGDMHYFDHPKFGVLARIRRADDAETTIGSID